MKRLALVLALLVSGTTAISATLGDKANAQQSRAPVICGQTERQVIANLIERRVGEHQRRISSATAFFTPETIREAQYRTLESFNRMKDAASRGQTQRFRSSLQEWFRHWRNWAGTSRNIVQSGACLFAGSPLCPTTGDSMKYSDVGVICHLIDATPSDWGVCGSYDQRVRTFVYSDYDSARDRNVCEVFYQVADPEPNPFSFYRPRLD